MYSFDEIRAVDAEIAEAIVAEQETEQPYRTDCFRKLGEQGGDGGNGKSADE